MLAGQVNTTAKVISQLERGVSVPSVEKLAEIAESLHTNLHDLFDFDEVSSDRRDRGLAQIGYMLRGRKARDIEAVRDILRLVFEIKRRERPTPLPHKRPKATTRRRKRS